MFLKQKLSTDNVFCSSGIVFGNVADCGGNKRQTNMESKNSVYDSEQLVAQPETASGFWM